MFLFFSAKNGIVITVEHKWDLFTKYNLYQFII